jgi:hypothetical protein
MPENPAPRVRAITSLALLAAVIDGQLRFAKKQCRRLLQARQGALDDGVAAGVVRIVSEEMEILDVYEAQLSQWREGGLTPRQRDEVERLGGQVARTREVAHAILVLAAQLVTGVPAGRREGDVSAADGAVVRLRLHTG